VAGAAGVLVTAIVGIFLAFTQTPEPPPQSSGEFDQESSLSPRSNSPSPPSTLLTATPALLFPAPSGTARDLSAAGSAAAVSDPLTLPWIQVVPPQPDPDLALPPILSPIGAPQPSSAPSAQPSAQPSELASAHRPARSAAPPQKRSVVPQPVGSPAPQAPPQAPPKDRAAPRPERRTVPPPARGGADPCATFHDFRREPCYSFLERLTKK
jgi:hypothetical protein